MVMGGWQKPGDPEKTHPDTGKTCTKNSYLHNVLVNFQFTYHVSTTSDTMDHTINI